MKIFGIDFTSSPSSCTSKAKSAKWMFLATCELNEKILVVKTLESLNGDKAEDYSQLATMLTSPGPWFAGIDVPFGMPIECIEYFKWLTSEDEKQDWTTYVERVRKINDRKDFKKVIESWRHPTKVNASGDKERVRKYRIIDKLINSQSPMNCIRPAVGGMFFEACEVLRATPASIPPVRRVDNENRYIVETYPRLVVNRLMGLNECKEADDLEDVRQQLVKCLSDTNAESAMQKWYGFTAKVEEKAAKECVEDWAGDKIDSILCAVQAAWVSRQMGCGIPRFATSVMNSIVSLEGWVPDPFVAKWRMTP